MIVALGMLAGGLILIVALPLVLSPMTAPPCAECGSFAHKCCHRSHS